MDTHPSRALVVDDERAIQRICRTVLEQMGFVVETSDNGALALELLDSTSFHLLVIDLRMPDIDGVEVLRQVRQRSNDVAIIVITGHASLEDTAETTLLGAQGILLKPFGVADLRSTVREVLLKRAEARAAAQAAALHPLLGISEHLLSELDLPRLCARIVATAQEGLHTDRVLLLLADDAGQHVEVAADGRPNATLTERHSAIAAWVMRHGRPLLIDEPDQVPLDLDLPDTDTDFQPALCVPLIAHRKVLGVLHADRLSTSPPFTPANQTLLTLLAGQVAIALENAYLYSLAQRRADGFRRLNALSTALTATLDLNQVMSLTAHHLSESLTLACGMILLRDDDGHQLTQHHVFGDPCPPRLSAQQLNDRSGVVGQVLNDGQPRLLPNARRAATLAPWERQLLQDDDQALLCVALATDKGIGGAIIMSGRQATTFGDEDLRFLEAVASSVALAVDKSRMHASIVRSEARYRALLEHAHDTVLVLNSSASAIVDANPAASKLSGYTREELLKLDPTQLVVTPATSKGPTGLRAMASADAGEFETRLRTRAGREVPIAAGVSEVIHDGSRYLLMLARDISERQRLAHRLIQTEKLAGMGRITASVAHEINNPLQGLQTSLHLVLNRPLDDDKRSKLLHKAQEEVEQLVTIVQRMLDFYRPVRDVMRPISLHDVLEQVLAMVGPQLQQRDIVVERVWDAHLPRVMGIGSHLKQVALSLILNAVDAMPEGGRLQIRTLIQDSTSGIARRLAVVEVSDTGPGIPEDEVSKIFEPFYTTRTNRTGLGLAVSYNIIEQHEGTLSVETNSEGTTFRVAIPIVQ